jgi:hypothetical protein
MNTAKIEIIAVPTPIENEKPRTYRFDVFKGTRDTSGKVCKVKSVGSALLTEGTKTYTLYIKTFLHDPFYILPEQKPLRTAD